MLRATPHLPSSPPSKSENASFSVAALLVQRCRGGAEGSLFSAADDIMATRASAEPRCLPPRRRRVGHCIGNGRRHGRSRVVAGVAAGVGLKYARFQSRQAH